MNKNKKISIGLTAGAFLFAFISIFMGFANGWSNELWRDGQLVGGPTSIQFYKIIFNQDKVTTLGFGGKTSAVLIIAFVIAILAIIGLATLLVLNLTNKSTQKINKGLMISLATALLIVFVLMVFSKGVCGVPDEDTSQIGSYTQTIRNKLKAGPICWAIFSLISGVAMIVAAVQNKKTNVQA